MTGKTSDLTAASPAVKDLYEFSQLGSPNVSKSATHADVTGPTHSSTSNPTASSDTTLGFKVGSTWFNSDLNTMWVCLDNTTSAAVWTTLGLGVLSRTTLAVDTTKPSITLPSFGKFERIRIRWFNGRSSDWATTFCDMGMQINAMADHSYQYPGYFNYQSAAAAGGYGGAYNANASDERMEIGQIAGTTSASSVYSTGYIDIWNAFSTTLDKPVSSYNRNGRVDEQRWTGAWQAFTLAAIATVQFVLNNATSYKFKAGMIFEVCGIP